MANLLYSRRRDAQELSYDEVAKLAPAVFTDMKHNELSDRYETVNTLDAMDALRSYGYVPVQAAQKRSKRSVDTAYAEHMVAFAHQWNLLDTDRPEIIIYNSHNGKSSMKMFAGFYRGICSNGLVAGEGFEARMRHLKASIADVGDMLEDVAAKLPEMADNVKRMKSIRLSNHQAIDFAYNTTSLRWDMQPDRIDPETTRGVFANEYTAHSMLRTRRWGDDGMDLWSVMNRTQETLIRGGATVLSYTDKNPYGSYRRTRPVGSVQESIRINRGVWDVTTDYMKEVA